MREKEREGGKISVLCQKLSECISEISYLIATNMK